MEREREEWRENEQRGVVERARQGENRDLRERAKPREQKKKFGREGKRWTKGEGERGQERGKIEKWRERGGRGRKI